ncbi:MAG: metallophosphoesterase [Oscillospiraceae bacterium]|nr:metallophosphoesterase [Oscillospiraceae bacterium]
MKKARLYVLETVVLILCVLCLSGPAASASGMFLTVFPLPEAENGILTVGGQAWYRVRGLESGGEYLIAVRDASGAQQMVAVSNGERSRYDRWTYTDYRMTPSTDPRISQLTAGGYPISYRDGELYIGYYYNDDGDQTWSHEDGRLCYRVCGRAVYLKYDAECPEPFSFTDDRSAASEIILYAAAPVLSRCITAQPAAESYVIEDSGYPAPVFSVGLAEGVTADSVCWFADGEQQPCTALRFQADCLTGQKAGVHRVSCLVEAHDSEGTHYREASAEAAFVIAKGVVPDSVMTFSDIHEEYHFIGDAIAAVMQETGGYIPSLVICSGDFVNGPTAYRDTELNRYFPQIVSGLGGLDAVFVAGNHDSAEAAAMMSAAAGLGASPELSPAGGLIFDGESEAVAAGGRNSRFAQGIVTYGINFASVVRNEASDPYYTYESVIGDTERFLQETAADYHGELVIISAHSGLHVIGMQPESETAYQSQLRAWLGDNIYNVDMAYELAETINRYAEQYDMDIIYLFGHNHSRGETELFLTDGDRLISPRCYSDRSFGSMTLHFTYANAGYLSSVIGSAAAHFTFLYRDGGCIRELMLSAEGRILRRSEIRAKHPYEAPSPAETTDQTTDTTAEKTHPETETTAEKTGSAQQIPAPETGDGQTAAAALAVPVLAVLLLSRNRQRT